MKAVVPTLALFVIAACSTRENPTALHVDAAHADAAHADAAHPDAAHADAAHADAAHADAAHADAAHADAAITPDAAIHVDAAIQPDAAIHPDAAIQIDAAVHVDAAVHIDAATLADAMTISDAGTPNVVSCYTEGNPAQSCMLPTHCCFSNYTSAHDGQCSNSACLWGTISCDGPEDCSGGQHCCSHALWDSNGDPAGYSLACQASACGSAPGDHEMCHIGGPACSNGLSCVNAYGVANDLPRTLDICH